MKEVGKVDHSGLCLDNDGNNLTWWHKTCQLQYNESIRRVYVSAIYKKRKEDVFN